MTTPLKSRTALARENRELRKHLRTLVNQVTTAVRDIDLVGNSILVKPAIGEKLAQTANCLEFAKDLAAHFGLGDPLRKRESPCSHATS